jgi:subtilisin-like proprotein convertase family protein
LKGTRIVVSRIVSMVIAAGLLAGMASGVLATAQSPPPDNKRHLLLVPTDAEGTAALARTDARVIARYEAFSLVEAQGEDDRRLRSAGADRRDDMRTVETAAGEIDPARDRPSLAAKTAPDRNEVLALVQFVGPPKEGWLARLGETGARIVSYQAENGYVVHASGRAVDRLAALQGTVPFVRAVSVLNAADKLEDGSSRSGVFAVTTVTGGPGEEARDEVAALAGAPASPPVTVEGLRTEYRALSSSEAMELAKDPGVVAIEAYAEPTLLDERAAQIVAGNVTGPPLVQPIEGSYLGWLLDPLRIPDESTFDFAIDVTDEGFDTGTDPPAHADFRERGSLGNPDRLAYVADYTTEPDARDCGGHGTHVASIAAGYNDTPVSPTFSDDRGFNHGLGVAPFAQVGASKIFRGCGDGAFSLNTTLTGITANAYGAGARISNNSWGAGSLSSWGNYTARSREYDQLVRDARPSQSGNQQMVEVFAAGNDGEGGPDDEDEGYGTISAEGTAKNVITVGAAEGVRAVQDLNPDCDAPNGGADSARDIVDFSSRGPTDDGRLKPDLVAPGTHITGAAPQHAAYNGFGVCHTLFPPGNTFYSLVSGTSQAAPQVSGAAALLRRWYRLRQGADPSPALTKALLVNSATDLAGGLNGKGDTLAPGPNTDQGWGRVNLGATFDGTNRAFRDQLPADTFGASGQSRLFAYSRDPAKPLKVTLAWTDAPGPTSGNPVVNNLDLVVDAGGQTYKGNVFYGAESRTGGNADPRNNVESVYLPPLPPGSPSRFAVKVVATNISGNGIPGNADSTDQDFALVVSNAVEEEEGTPVLVHESTAIDDSPSVGGDGDGALEPDESFELEESIRNAGTAPATNTSGKLTAGGALTITTENADWPASVGVGTTAGNTTPFEGELTSSAPCGKDVSATLGLTTVEGPHRVPLTLPTGVEGPPVVWPAEGPPPPVEIPDDDAGGVTSTIDVTTPGWIKDVNVRIEFLNHDFVGDLRIELIAPDGTTVTLVEHPGGPDNGGNDFEDTVFDDEASANISTGRAPYGGTFRAQNDQLSRLNGKPQLGPWNLRVRDLFEGPPKDSDDPPDALVAWGLDLSRALCSVDSAAPNTSIDDGPEPGSTVPSNEVTFEVSSIPPGADFQCKLDGARYDPCTPPVVYRDLADGSHVFRVRADDGARVDPTPASRTWTVDTTAPETLITDGPGARVKDRTASFQFVSPDTPDAEFRCSLDGSEPVADCTEPYVASGLSDGAHTFEVWARDAVGNEDATPATHIWVVDNVAPSPSVTSPPDGSTTQDPSPVISGTAGSADGDDGVVTVKLFAGTLDAGLPAQTLFVPVAGGAWSVEPSALADGTYTARAEQADSAGNVGSSAPVRFAVDAPEPPLSGTGPGAGGPGAGTGGPTPGPAAPSFLVAPAEEHIADALAGRLAVTAACASACEVRAKLTVSPRAAQGLGMGAKQVALGGGDKRLPRGGAATLRVGLTKRARAALRQRRTARATLRVTVVEGAQRLVLTRALSLHRSAGPKRVVARGLPLWTVCSARCPVSGDITISARTARRIGLRPRGSARVTIASGRTTSTAGKPARLTLKVRRGAKNALSRASNVEALLKTVAGPASGPQRTASTSVILRR